MIHSHPTSQEAEGETHSLPKKLFPLAKVIGKRPLKVYSRRI